jgi:putative ATP-dependent endonuclease of OLD family
LEFDEVSPDEAIQALFLHGTGELATQTVSKATYNLIFRPRRDIRLKFSELQAGDSNGLQTLQKTVALDDYEAFFTGRSQVNFEDVDFYAQCVGDFENVIFPAEVDHPGIGSRIPPILSIPQEISFTFIQALRDVVSEFHNNRTNPLLTLLKSRSDSINQDLFAPIVEQVKVLNTSIESLPDVQTIRHDITRTIREAAGETYSPAKLSIQSDLSDEAEKLFQSLKLFVGESDDDHEGPIHELSLGGANLVYLTLKLLEFNYRKDNRRFANFLIIEEPEAHIHTHIQKTLFDRLQYADTQIIYSTHSTHISEVSNVSNINIIGRNFTGSETYYPAKGLDPESISHIQRYLDAIRSNLLFAKSVLLVEGDAEEILIPVLIKKYLGLSLDELGISLINIRSTGFENIALLFHDERIRKKCSIITDRDTSIISVDPDAADTEAMRKFRVKCANSDIAGRAREVRLETFCANNSWVKPFYAETTFEVEFVRGGNTLEVSAAIDKLYSGTAKRAALKADLENPDIGVSGRCILKVANKVGKGWFALLISEQATFHTHIPSYILEAVGFAHPVIKPRIWAHIFRYRVRAIRVQAIVSEQTLATFEQKISQFEIGFIDFDTLKTEFRLLFPDDSINQFLTRY